MSSWIGPVPLSSEFRSSLLRAGDVDKNLLARYKNIAPETARITAIESWIVSSTETPPIEKRDEIHAVDAKKLSKSPSGSPIPVDPEPSSTPKRATVADTVLNEKVLSEDELGEEDENLSLLTSDYLLNRQLYYFKLLKWTYERLEYPQRARNHHQEGGVRLAVTIDQEGNILNISVVDESSYVLHNREAVNAVKQAESYPAMPKELKGEHFVFSLPIVFRMPGRQ